MAKIIVKGYNPLKVSDVNLLYHVPIDKLVCEIDS